MDFKNKNIAIIATLDDMIERFMPPHIKFLLDNGANRVDCYCKKTDFVCSELENMKNVNIIDVPFTRSPFTFKNIKAYKELKKKMKERKYDLVSCMQPVGGVMGRLVSHKLGIPCLYTAHGFHFFKGNSKLKNFIFCSIEKYFSKYTDVLVTINQEDYDAALKFKAKKVYKINGIGVDLNKFKPNNSFNKQEFRKALGLNEDDFIVTSVGELNENKNTLRIVDAIHNIPNEKIKYLACGRGPLQSVFEEKIKEYGLQERVKLLGFRKDIPNILSITDLFVMPSYREGLGLATVEAMCYGLPVIASDTRGSRDLVGKNEGGILCNPRSTEDFTKAINTLVHDKKLSEKYGKRNKEEVKQYDVNLVLEQMKEIYEEIN